MTWSLPKTVEIQGVEYQINWDYRCILDIFEALADPELDSREKSAAVLICFYPDAEKIPPGCVDEAIRKCFDFINCTQDSENRKSPRLVDWNQDFLYICGPVNRVLGRDVREAESLHWWTFLSAYMEIGDCTFAQIVNIRDKLAHGKSLDKQERKWYQQNRHLVDFKDKYSTADEELLRSWNGAAIS